MNSDARVEDLMTTKVVATSGEEKLSKVLSIMKKSGIHELPVVEKKRKLIGFFSTDLLSQRRHIPIYSKISNLMTAPPRIKKENGVLEAGRIMLETGFRALPVVDNKNSLIGIISATDIVHSIPKMNNIDNTSAGEIMTPEPVALEISEGVEDALKIMNDLGEICAPVVQKNGKVAGCVSLHDISKSVWHAQESAGANDRVGENHSPKIDIKNFVSPVAIVSENTTIKDICSEMSEISPYICLVSNGSDELVGVITQYDILKKLVKYTPDSGVYVDITGLEIKDPFLYSTLVSKIERFIKKIGRFSWIKPYSLNLHVENHNKGGRTRWVIKAKLRTDKGMMYIKNQEWDLLKCVDSVSKDFSRKLTDLKPD